MLYIKSTLPPIPSEICDKKGNSYKVGKMIGEGGFGCVYIVKGASNKEYACKATCISNGMSEDSFEYTDYAIEEERDKLMNEAKILESLDHPNIVGFKCSFHDDNYVYMIMELCDRSLSDYLKTHGSVSEEQAVYYTLQLLSSVAHCHQRNIIHRDIKLQNILLTNNNNTLKLADFGLSKKVVTKEEMLKSCCGTISYMAPEIIDCSSENGYSFKVDIWSTCIVLYRLVYGAYPFNADNRKLAKEKIKSGKFKFLSDKEVSKEFKHCVMRIFDVNPRFRPTITQILDFPLFKKYLDKINFRSIHESNLSLFNIFGQYESSLNMYIKDQTTQGTLTKKRKLSKIQSTTEEGVNSSEIISGESYNPVVNSFTISSPYFKHGILSLINNIYSKLGEAIKIGEKPLDREVSKRNKLITPVFVTKTFTLGPNYGIGYELTNGIQAMLFKDGSTLSYNPSNFDYYSYYINLNSSNSLYNYSEIRKLLACKITRFISCCSILSNYKTTLTPQAPYGENSEKVYVVRYFKTAAATVLFFTSGTIQFNFNDYRKLILSQDARTLSLIRPNRKNINFNAVEAIHSFFNTNRHKSECDELNEAEFNEVDCYYYIILARNALNDIAKEGYFEG